MNIREAIRELARNGCDTVPKICTVDSVDRKARTVDCTPIDEGTLFLGVNLQANQGCTFGAVMFPKVGSYVVVGLVADGAAGVVLLTDDIESVEVAIGGSPSAAVINKDGIIFNGGTLGGLVKVEALTTRINTIENDINELKKVFSSWTVMPQDGGAVLKTASSAWARNKLELTSRGDYENKTIRQ